MLFLTLLLLLLAAPSAGAQQARSPIYTVEARGIITSVTTSYLRDALQVAEAAGANALIIVLDSHGGVLSDVRPFAAELATAEVPVVVYVAPAGTQSGATGALFLSAAHLSALAPGTSFGSPYPLTRVDDALSQQTRDMVFDSVADQLRGWNERRGRNTAWVDQAVRDGAVLTNEQAIALRPPAIDMVASDLEQLLVLLEGRTLTLASGRQVRLATLGQSPTRIEPNLWQSIRLALADPTVAFAFLVLGALAFYLEIAAPGTSIFAGFGVIMLIAAALGLVVLPLQWWGVALLLLALLLIGAEFFVPVHGGLLITGVMLMVVGGLNLIDPTQAPGTSVALWMIVVVALVLATFAAIGIWLAMRTRGQPVTTGQEGLVGRLAEVRRRLDPEGMVFVEGALWQAISENGAAEVGEQVRVAATHNLRLVVRRLEDDRGP